MTTPLVIWWRHYQHLVAVLYMISLHLALGGVELHHFYAETLVIVEQNALSNRRYSRRIRIRVYNHNTSKNLKVCTVKVWSGAEIGGVKV